MRETQYLDARTLQGIIEQVSSSALATDLTLLKPESSVVYRRGAVVAYAGQIQVEGQKVTIHIGFNDIFPLSLPLIYVIPPDVFGFIPHVSRDGSVCYVQSEGLLLDSHNPAGILEEAIQRAIFTLSQGVNRENLYDFVDEFETYWWVLSPSRSALSFVSPSEELREVVVVRSQTEREHYLFIADSVEVVSAYLNHGRVQQGTLFNAIYVPLQDGTLLIPPEPGAFWDLQEIQTIVQQNVSTGNLRQLRKYTRKFKREEVLIFRLPRTKEGEVLFGVRCGGVAGCHPLVPGGSVRDLTPIQLMRMDKEYLLPRSGANPGLSGKKVALIGCGAVGGFVALELVRMGILNLTLIDPDDLSGGNTFRHVLGQQGSGHNKAVALKEEIERKFPYVSIQAISLAAEQALVAGCFHPRAFDLIVVAIGASMTSLHLNKLFHDRSGTPPTLFTWLEAYGIGGHALLTLNGCRQGCLACLFTPLTEEDEGTGDRSSFAAKGQVYAKDLRGCGMSFTPFGSLAAVRTAALAVELAGQALSGAITGNPLRSWKGDAQEFLHAGYCVSDRYPLSAEELFKQRFLYMNPRCPVCGQGKWYG